MGQRVLTTGSGSNPLPIWGKYGKYMEQRDVLLVLDQTRSVHRAKRPTTGAGFNTVGSWGKRTCYWCWLKYGQ